MKQTVKAICSYAESGGVLLVAGIAFVLFSPLAIIGWACEKLTGSRP